MLRYFTYLKVQGKFFIRSGLYLIVVFLLFLVALDIYGRQLIYVSRLDVYTANPYRRDIPLVNWVSSKESADAYIDNYGTLHIQTYNQLKRNLLIYLFSGTSSDWKVIVVENLLNMDMMDFYDTLYGVFFMIVVSFITGYHILIHKIRKTGKIWRVAGLSKWEVLLLEMFFALMLSVVALVFQLSPYVFITTFLFFMAFAMFVGAIAKNIESYTALIKIFSLLFIIPVLYFFVGDKIPLFLWYLVPTFHIIMVIVAPIFSTPLGVGVHTLISVFVSAVMLGTSFYLLDF